MTRKLYYVEWIDASSLTGSWQQERDVKDLAATPIKTVGWAVKETKDELVLVSSWSPDCVDGNICIPRRAIVRTKVLSGLSIS